MKTQLIRRSLLVLACVSALNLATMAQAAEAKNYQVTGPILELTPTTITVQKGDEKWQLARSGSTKVTGDLKVGAKVTIHYQMVASDIEVKAAKSEGKGESKSEGKKKKES